MHRHYLEAAVAGQPEAQSVVANMYFNGDGIAADYVLAYAWALIAKQSVKYHEGNLVSTMLKADHRLTTKEMNEGEKIAGEWSVGHMMQRIGE